MRTEYMFIRRKDFDPRLKEGSQRDYGMNPVGILLFSGDANGVCVTLAMAHPKDGFDKRKGLARCKGLLNSAKTVAVEPKDLENHIQLMLFQRKNRIPYSSRIENFTKVFIRKVTDPLPPKV